MFVDSGQNIVKQIRHDSPTAFYGVARSEIDHLEKDDGPVHAWTATEVRNVYTAFIGSSWAYALLVARPTALFGAAVLTVVMAVKARAEEAFLRRELGAADYDAYAARTPMLVPTGSGLWRIVS